MRFTLQRHWWRGQIVIRFGPSSQHWDLRIEERPGRFWHLVMSGDPRRGPVAGYEKPMRDHFVTAIDGKKVDVMTLRGQVRLKPKTPANPTKETPAFLETLDFGTAEWLERQKSVAKLALKGKRGTYVLFMRRESPDSPFWEVSPSEGPKVKKQWDVELIKADEEKQLVYGVVLRPDRFDSQGDLTPEDEIEKAAHQFMERSRLIDWKHIKTLTHDKAVPVESYIAPQDLKINGRVVPKGSWILVTHVKDPALWRAIKAGEIRSYSIRGFGVRAPVD